MQDLVAFGSCLQRHSSHHARQTCESQILVILNIARIKKGHPEDDLFLWWDMQDLVAFGSCLQRHSSHHARQTCESQILVILNIARIKKGHPEDDLFLWWDMQDLNLRPPGYEPGALTN